ncbi:hypothetical protein B0I35DRAFT_441064 [Stachybotrys elegans]|uniref:Uncharacterized protein n=1 Tax=Stachybotrys elegans TaxID=80388 RepID=A0A8K0WM23_9HYPO|nr:hypothetical protein B0I35DRAFT_441064 [Stachybotrys elegans]
MGEGDGFVVPSSYTVSGILANLNTADSLHGAPHAEGPKAICRKVEVLSKTSLGIGPYWGTRFCQINDKMPS